MKIDIFAHLMPRKYRDTIYKKAGRKFLMLEIPTLTDLDHRFRIMDAYPEMVQVVTTVGPVPEAIAKPDGAAELARLANDEMAEVVARYPDRFLAAVATLPMNNIDAALMEAQRAIKELGMKGIIIHTPVNGKPLDLPEFMPLYEMMSRFELPIWLHPRREQIPDYASESTSKYWIWCLWGWPYETTVSMTRLVYSGVFDKYPNLKFITHHCGAMVPYFEGRISCIEGLAKFCGKSFGKNLKRPLLDYYRMFYNDTAIHGSSPGLMTGYHFFGSDRILFGADYPFEIKFGEGTLRDTIKAIDNMDIPGAHKKKIYEENAKRLLGLSIT
jgi:predicted TIM-barrel fold metal-dependent hydrolase